MKQVITTLVDDLDGGEAEETVKFGLDGTQYEIDLSADNAAALRELLAPYVKSGTKASKVAASANGTARAHATPVQSRRSQDRAVREWYRESYPALRLSEPSLPSPADRGRIPGRVRTLYREHGGTVVASGGGPVATTSFTPDEYDKMGLDALRKLARGRGGSTIAREGRAPALRQWLRDHPEGTEYAQATAKAGREMHAKKATAPAEEPAETRTAPSRANLTPAERKDLNEQVKRFAALHGHDLSGRKGRIPEPYYAAQYHSDPSLLPAQG